MLSCPFCQFENIGTPQVCQQCGASLPTWYALCLPQKTVQAPLSIGPCLDPDQRYHLSKPNATLRPARAMMIRVIDSRPDQASPLKPLQTAWLENPQLQPNQSDLTHGIPPQAFPYLALQADYFPAIPEIHDAFHHNGYTALLIEDRGIWPSLDTRWKASQDSVLQQIQWLFEMVLLWEALIPWHKEATLLQTNRLVIDRNDLLCLTHIDPSIGTGPVPLKKLGASWLQLTESAGNSTPDLIEIITDLAAGHIPTTEKLKAILADLSERWPHAPVEDAAPKPDATPAPQSLSVDQTSSIQSLTQTAEMTATGSGSRGAVQTTNPTSESQAEKDTSQVTARVTNPGDEKADPPELPTIVLPMKLVQIDEAGQTHVGMQRNHNEDYFFAKTNALKINTVGGITLSSKGLYIVCDGMGGHASGEVASQLAVQTLTEFFEQHWKQGLPDQRTLVEAVRAANQAIYDVNQDKETSGLGRMGTTLVMLLIHNLTAAVVHVGDSRLYSYCKRLGLRQLTLDHEVGQREINRGVEPSVAYARPDAYQLTQALGPRHEDEIRPTVAYHDIAEDTLFLLCSDGLSDNTLLERYQDSHIAPLLSSRANLENGLADLIDLANEENGHDNITAIVTRLKLRPDMTNLPR